MKDNLEFKESLPIYLQLRDILREKIEQQEYVPGVKMPSETKLAEDYSISRVTVRNTIDILVKEGLVKRVPGKGLYVLPNKYEEQLSHSEGIFKLSNIEDDVEVIAKYIRNSESLYSLLFGIDKDEPLLFCRLLIKDNMKGIGMEDLYIPLNVNKNIKDIDLKIYKIMDLWKSLGVPVDKVKQNLKIVKASKSVTKYLGLKENENVVKLETKIYTHEDKLIQISLRYNRMDTYNYHVEFHK